VKLRRALAALSACMIALIAAGAAHAQVDPDIEVGSKIPRRSKEADPVTAGLTRDLYRDCTYSPNRTAMDFFLAQSDPGSADLKAAGINGRKLFDANSLRDCFVAEGRQARVELRMRNEDFRYIMLEGAYLYAVRQLPAGYANKVPAPRTFVSKNAELGAARPLAALADCIAEQDPVGADAILRTPSGTDKERAAAKALVPALSACMVAGRQYELKAANIRAFAADGMWQRYVKAAPVMAEAGR
jgi:hypothetical protein